jgi:hypothetical protein
VWVFPLNFLNLSLTRALFINSQTVQKGKVYGQTPAKKYLLNLEKDNKVKSEKEGRAVYWWLSIKK